MPPVPAVRGSQVVSALEKAGFVVARINGSHHIMRHPDGRRTTVPVHAGLRSPAQPPTTTTPMFHRCRYNGTHVPSVLFRLDWLRWIPEFHCAAQAGQGFSVAARVSRAARALAELARPRLPVRRYGTVRPIAVTLPGRFVSRVSRVRS
jgi:predicted RNA binding protein YcfA (HicA-like mRNA interferase family)